MSVLFAHLLPLFAPLPLLGSHRNGTLSKVDDLTVYGTGFKEHGCASGWCPLASSVAEGFEKPAHWGAEPPLAHLTSGGATGDEL